MEVGEGAHGAIPFVLVAALIFNTREDGLCSKRVTLPSGKVEVTGTVVSKLTTP